ncbi:recombinase family protein [Allokutzneria sp. A3M-2-11 16]|uniref:recombinase family protein n=1 Tax=Allokutzneria sp. A3M-2-11 16 TaxID=2962043 RepID=UPI0020B8B60B|nr:recombinase family protein [Allokutzneria sp. A3M-2-11 16]MCP3804964.1 recombinase family protein [Allokutzneria sp. A3M-2-11 16]
MGSKRDVSAGQGGDRPLVLDSYGRLSRVPETGELEKIDTQWADNRKVIERIGASLGEQLKDGLSAWKRSVRRPGWERLLERVESGESDGIVVWHTDRLFRQPRDLEKLIELGERGFKIYSAHGERDLSRADDRFILRIEVAQACKSSDDTSRRIKRRFATKREQGAGYLGGPRRFGWPGKDLAWVPGPEETDKDRPDVTADQVERERTALREGTDAQLAGIGQGTIANEWNAAGLRTALGREWIAVTVKSVLSRPMNAGLIEHDGKLVGRMEGDPIVDPEDFERLRAIYAARRRGRVVGERYIGTGILRCWLCRMKLSAAPKDTVYKDTGERRAVYFCNKQRRGCGKVYGDRRAIDHELRLLVIARQSDSRHASAVAAARARVADRLADLRAEIGECEQLQEALSERLGLREIRLDAFDRANKPLAADLARLRAERDQLSGGNADGPVEAQPPEEVARQWDDGDVSERRTMLTSALEKNVLYLKPAARTGARVFDRERLTFDDPEDPSGTAE